MKFTKSVRRQKIKTPLQRGFTLEKWKSTFANACDVDEQDKSLYEAGIFAFAELTASREAVEKIQERLKSENGRLRVTNELFLAYFNWTILKIQQDHQRYGKSYEEKKLSHITLDGRMEIITESIFYPIMHLKNYGNISSDSFGETLEYLRLWVNLGAYYRSVENQFLECLYEIKLCKNVGDKCIYTSANPKQEKNLSASMSRRNSILLEKQLIGTNIFGDTPEQIFKVQKEKGKWKVKSIDKRSLYAVNSFVLPGIPEHSDDKKIGVKERACFKGLSIIQMMYVLRTIGFFAEAVLKQQDSVKEFEDKTHKSFLGTTSRSELVRVITRALGITKVQAIGAIEFYRYKYSNKRDELWHHPLFVESPNTIHLNFSSLLGINQGRVFSYLVAYCDPNGIEMGDAFEDSINKHVREASKSCRQRNIETFTKPSNKWVIGDEVYEEIDLVFKINNTIFVCECKNLTEDPDIIGIYNARRTLVKGAEQAKRKVDFLKSHFFKDEVYSFYPLVVTNNLLYSGEKHCEVSVTDRFTLGSFLEEKDLNSPKAQKDSLKLKNGKLIGKQLEFFKNRSNSEEHAEEFFSNPPHYLVREEFLKQQDFPAFSPLSGRVSSIDRTWCVYPNISDEVDGVFMG